MKKILSLILSLAMAVTMLTCLVVPASAASTPATTWTLTKDNFTAADSNFSFIYNKTSDLRDINATAATASSGKLVDTEGGTVAESNGTNITINCSGYAFSGLAFTAPTDGTYTFHLEMYRVKDNGWANVWACKDGSSFPKVVDSFATQGNSGANTQDFTVTLTAGQKIGVGINRAGNTECVAVLTNVSVTRAAINDTPITENAWSLTKDNFTATGSNFSFIYDKTDSNRTLDDAAATVSGNKLVDADGATVVEVDGSNLVFSTSPYEYSAIAFTAPTAGTYTFNFAGYRTVDGGWSKIWEVTPTGNKEAVAWVNLSGNTYSFTVELAEGQKIACGFTSAGASTEKMIVTNVSVTLATEGGNEGDNEGGNEGGSEEELLYKKGYKFDMVKGFGIAEKYECFSFVMYGFASNTLVLNTSTGEFNDTYSNVMLKPKFDSDYKVIGVDMKAFDVNGAPFTPAVVFTAPQAGKYTFEANVQTSFAPTDDEYKNTIYFYYTDGTNELKKVYLNTTDAAKLSCELDLKTGDTIYLVYVNNNNNVQKWSTLNSYTVTYEKKAAATGDNTLSAIALLIVAGVGITVLKKKKH